jgi:hypothetical protein
LELSEELCGTTKLHDLLAQRRTAQINLCRYSSSEIIERLTASGEIA